MKKISILVLAIFAITLTSCKKEDVTAKIKAENLKNAQKKVVANRVDAPVMTFEETVHDFGTIEEGVLAETKFKFTNTGKSDLIITNVKGSCGCTVPSNWKKEPIKPGETSEFTVKYNSKNRPNKINKSVTITCNTNKGKEVVRISGFVNPDPEAEKKRAEQRKKRAEAAAKRRAEQAKNGVKQAPKKAISINKK